MKKFLQLLSLALMATFALAACNDHEESVEIPLDEIANLEPQLKETDDALILSWGEAWGDESAIAYRLEYHFERNLCVRATETRIFYTAEEADEAEQLLAEDEDLEAPFTRKGNTLVLDYTEQYEGASKLTVREMLEWRKQQILNNR
ncbi:MAG: hypothetical protein K6C30_00100 [Bacteroidaceae bacterium]|nr:hypothetical protein [Bacteroidaceae bacterium]